MQKNSFKIIAIRSLSILLMVFALVFGVTWKKYGVCLGDRILTSLGLPAWSNGASGTHYSAILAMIMLLCACALFAKTTKSSIKHG